MKCLVKKKMHIVQRYFYNGTWQRGNSREEALPLSLHKD